MRPALRTTVLVKVVLGRVYRYSLYTRGCFLVGVPNLNLPNCWVPVSIRTESCRSVPEDVEAITNLTERSGSYSGVLFWWAYRTYRIVGFRYRLVPNHAEVSRRVLRPYRTLPKTYGSILASKIPPVYLGTYVLYPYRTQPW